MAAAILVVDDEEDVREVIALSLSNRGYEIETAANGTDALARMRAKRFDLVLLDVMMPVVTGIEVCRLAKADPALADVPIVFLTAKGGGDALAEGLEAGALMYLQKPFTTEKLVRLIDAALGTDQSG
jgi:CheY-like chemotaxis protein